ncbi:MAG: hypothetical protein R3B57_10870 [Phycisphaerales bacterium]
MQRVAGVALTLVVLGSLGCQSGPRGPIGDTQGRRDPGVSTRADSQDPAVNSVTLIEFADQVAQDLPARIASIPELANRDHEAVLYLGEFINRTNTPTNDFRLARQIVRNSIINSDIVRQYATVYADPEQLARLRERLAASESGRVSDDEMNGRLYSADDIFVLNSEMSEATRGGGAQSLYVFDMTLLELKTGRQVFSSQIVQKFVR